MVGLVKSGRRALATLAALLLPVLLAAAIATVPAPAAKPRLARPSVTKVGTSTIELRWRGGGDARRWSVRHRADGAASWTRATVRGARSATVKGLDRGTVYEAQVAPCRRGRCGPWSNTARTATLLAPINGPHPDPGCGTFPASDSSTAT